MKVRPIPKKKLWKTLLIHLINWVPCHICEKQYKYVKMYKCRGEYTVWYVCPYCAKDGVEAYEKLLKKGIGSH